VFYFRSFRLSHNHRLRHRGWSLGPLRGAVQGGVTEGAGVLNVEPLSQAELKSKNEKRLFTIWETAGFLLERWQIKVTLGKIRLG